MARNLYELLGVASDASPLQIQKASDSIIKTFSRDELAMYSLLESNEDRENFLREIQQAVNILMDQTSREAYDERLQIAPRYQYPVVENSELPLPDVSTATATSNEQDADEGQDPPIDDLLSDYPIQGGQSNPQDQAGSPAIQIQAESQASSQEHESAPKPKDRPSPVESGIRQAHTHEELIELFNSIEFIDGPALKRLREANGSTVQEVAHTIKISMTQLKALEERKYRDLPARVYVRGFVHAFARYLRIDPKRTVQEYMEYFGD